MQFVFFFLLFPGEWYEDSEEELHTCEGLEDPSCSAQWYYTTISDHMTYLTLPLGCTAVSRGQYKSVMYA